MSLFFGFISSSRTRTFQTWTCLNQGCRRFQPYLLVFSRVSEAGEDGHAHGEVEQQDSHLPVAVLWTQGGQVGY